MKKKLEHVLFTRARDVSRVMDDMSCLEKDLKDVLDHQGVCEEDRVVV
jgi:hypothetical protein